MFSTCSLPGLKVIKPRVFRDERGSFWENYRKPLYAEGGVVVDFLQDNVSISRRHTIRGLHYQKGQAKLVSVLSGKIWDVAVDIREDSPTFGRYEAVELDDQERKQFYLPDGFAHGFCVLSETATVLYKVSAVYNPAEERAIRWNDPLLGIDWPCKEPILSMRDQTNPFFEESVFS